MGAIIKATAVSRDPSVRSSIAHAARAGRECVAAAGISLGEVGVLINCGVYRDDNMMEPAMAALIQREIGLGLDFTKTPGERPVVSFDLMNGACGLLNATQVAGAFLQTDPARYVLIVTSDAHPSNAHAPEFPYATVGGAMLLERGPHDRAGFGRLAVSASKAAHGVDGFVVMSATARGEVTVTREPGYAERLGELAARTASDYAEAERLDLQKTLLISSQPTPNFAESLASRLGMGAGHAVSISASSGEPHSAALAIGYHQAIEQRLFDQFEQVLFVAAGAGLSCACAVYRR